jgi:hypothetical protein
LPEALPPTFAPSEQQALATVAHALEQSRFFWSHQWQVTNYVLIALSVLAAAPTFVGLASWPYWAKWTAFLPVCFAVGMAWRQLSSLRLHLNRERERLDGARERLLFMRGVYDFPTKRSQPYWRRFFWTRYEEQYDLPISLDFYGVVLVGGLIASLIIWQTLDLGAKLPPVAPAGS